MALTGLLALKERVSGLADLEQYFVDNFADVQPKHFIGYKRIINGAWLPAICYVPIATDETAKEATEEISIVIQIAQKTEDDDGYLGLFQINDIAEIILKNLTHNLGLDNGMHIQPQFETVNNIVSQFPFFEMAIKVKILWRGKIHRV